MRHKLRFSVWFTILVLTAFLAGYSAWAKSTSGWPYDNVFIPYPERSLKK